MNKVKIIISIVLCMVLSFNSVIVASAADDSAEDNILQLINAEYTRSITVSNKRYNLRIKLNTMNFTNNEFTGEYFVTGSNEYYQEISGGVSKDIFWNNEKENGEIKL